MKRYGKCLVVLFIIMALLCGCGKKENISHGSSSGTKKNITIGLSFDSFMIERWIRDRDAFESYAKEKGADVIIQNANGQIRNQIEQIYYLIEKKVDAIVVIASNCDDKGLADALKKAHDRGIKIIAYDRLIMNVPLDALISFHNEKAGRQMGISMCEHLKKGSKILMISGPKTDHNVIELDDGFISEIKKGGLSIVGTEYCKEWKSEYAGKYIEKVLQKESDIKGIMCGNDDLASQVAKVLAEKRLLGKIVLVGQDADLLACQRIVEDTQLMTVYKNIDVLARTAVECTIQLIQNQEVHSISDAEISEVDNKLGKVKSVLLYPKAVTKKNMNQVIIKSGYHTKEDVYLNRVK